MSIMDTQKPYYRKATGHPVYYWIDPETKQIESVKNWGDRPKSIERYVYQESFAQNIRRDIRKFQRDTIELSVCMFCN